MPIGRSTSTPEFLLFPLKFFVRIPQRAMPPLIVLSLRAEPLVIPSWQRGIEWRRENVNMLIDSSSAMYGTAILAELHDQPKMLVDGLQRFATGTALLNVLYPKVLSPTPTDPSAAAHFVSLRARAQSFQPIFSYNADGLRTHPRKALANSYGSLEADVEALVLDELGDDPQDFARRLEIMLLDKQIAIDSYTNLENERELTDTFININSQGIDLSPIDLMRGKIVSHALSRGWTINDIEGLENDYTDTFENPIAKNHLKSLGNILNDAIDKPVERDSAFPAWDQLTRADVERLLDFIDATVASARSRQHTYLSEIFECGALPFAAILLRYHEMFRSGGFNPSHQADFAGGQLVTANDCHVILCACYRRVIDGTIGRTEDISHKLLKHDIVPSDIANEINPPAAGALSSAPNEDWLSQRLRQMDRNQSRRVFNACLLPPRTTLGGTFHPFAYGKGNYNWTVDHLIPESSIRTAVPGEHEGDQLPNFAPLPSSVNKSIRNNPCSTKLGQTGPYRQLPPGSHAYIDWLLNSQYAYFNQHQQLALLDNQAHLVPNADPPVGDDRIEQLVLLLRDRL